LQRNLLYVEAVLTIISSTNMLKDYKNKEFFLKIGINVLYHFL